MSGNRCVLGELLLSVDDFQLETAWIFSVSSFKELFGYGSKLMLSGWLNIIYVQLSPLIIGRFYSSSALGYYTRAQSYAYFPSSNIMGILQQVVFPVLSRLQDED